MTIQQAKEWGAAEIFGAISVDSSRLDAECLLQWATGLSKTQVLFSRGKELTQAQEATFRAGVEKRKTGLPIAYITGKKEFFGRDFFVTPSVLIPKPDTELLVEKVLEELSKRTNAKHILTICDMCTGSGCVGLSVFAEIIEQKMFPREMIPSVTLVDISGDALAVAKKNAAELIESEYLERVRFVQSNLFEAVPLKFDVILSNPPYIPHREAVALLSDGRAEPMLALDGDVDLFGNATAEDDGLGIMRNFVPQAFAHLSPHGVCIAESGEYNADDTAELFRAAGFRDVCIFTDLAGQKRDTIGRK
ncbi:MAG: peptide chain release factor N(5)-glutamine methyltransferase [Spirochaetaceae bacterium]|nr:peptide chain release factor N(5)-glutamine methyltransferase [Spirochaetaceae bacterium]